MALERHICRDGGAFAFGDVLVLNFFPGCDIEMFTYHSPLSAIAPGAGASMPPEPPQRRARRSPPHLPAVCSHSLPLAPSGAMYCACARFFACVCIASRRGRERERYNSNGLHRSPFCKPSEGGRAAAARLRRSVSIIV